MKVQEYEGYTITDKIRIGSIMLAIGEGKDDAVPYVTVEYTPAGGYAQPHFLRCRIAAEVDLLKRAAMQMQGDLREMSVAMQAALRKVGDVYEL